MTKKILGLEPISLLTDIEEVEKPTDAFKTMSKKIAGVIVKSHPRYTIGLYGEWGSGKTTLMRLIQESFSVDGNESVLTVWFNAWRYEHETEKATVPLILTILEELVKKNHDDTITERLKTFVKGWSVHLSLPLGFATLGISHEDKNHPDNDLCKIPKPSLQEGVDLITSISEKINSSLENKLKLVVFIDDLDRCSPTKALEVFESIKILLDILGIVYVIGLNLKIINQKIKAENEKNKITTNNYIDKIIQIPARLPTWKDTDLAEIFTNNIKDNIDKKYFEILEKRKHLLFKAVKGNPRQLKRTINSFIISKETLGENTDSEKLLIVDLMHFMWPDMFERFSTTKPFRDKILNLLEDDNRISKIKELRAKKHTEFQLEPDDEFIIQIEDDLWDFFRETKKDLFGIPNWTEYTSITKHLPSEEELESMDSTLFYKGNALYYDKKYPEAIKYYDYAIKRNPNHVEAYNHKGDALARLDRHDEAIECFDIAIKINPNYVDAYNHKGDALARLDRHDEAIECFDIAIKINPNYVDAYNHKGVTLARLDRHDEAIECYDIAIKINPNYANAYYNKGVTLARLDRHDEAIECFDIAIKINPNYANAYYNKGVTLARLDRHDEAIECFDIAIKINPNSADVYYNKGFMLARLDRHDEAIECFDIAIKINPNYANAYFNKGVTLARLDRHDEAIECFDIAIKINPNSADVYHNKGVTLARLDRHDEAIECFDIAIKINPNYANTYHNKGDVLARLDRHDEAIECFDIAIKINPNYANTYHNKGDVLARLDRHDEAIECFDIAIKINPNYANAYNNKGVALARLDRHDEAIECFDIAIKINPNYADVYHNKGIALGRLDRHDEAIECFDIAKKLENKDKS